MIGLSRQRAMALSVAVVLCGALLTSCVTSERTYQGAGAGGALGALTGVLIDKDNRWRGALIGGAIGALLGGTVTEIAARASREAAQQGQTVTYTSEDGSQRVVATPAGASPQPNCRRVREQIYQDGRLVRDHMKDVCG
jgi:outer membrane lipoprotein SlyB